MWKLSGSSVADRPLTVAAAAAADAEDHEKVRNRGAILCRAFVSLLRLTGLSGSASWSARLWSAALYGLQTAMTFHLLRQSLEAFAQLRNAGTPFFGALTSSNFVAIPNVVEWAALTASFVWGRRHYGTLLSQVHAILADIDKLPRLTEKRKPSHYAGEYVWAFISATVVMFSVTNGVTVASVCREGSTQDCVFALCHFVAFGYIYIALQLVAIKFIFAGLMLNSGFIAVNEELEAFVTNGCEEVRLRQIGQLQKQLSDVFIRLTSSMTAELVFTVAYGILVEIVICLLLVNLSTLDVARLLRLLMFLSAAFVAMVGPCETCQLLLKRLGHSRDLLLQLEWQQPQLAEPTQLMQKLVARDLETFGDLSFFFLRRSTLSGITTTVLTYIIVMVQFQMSEYVSPAAGNATDHHF